MSLTVTACDWTNYMQSRDNVAQNRTFPIKVTRCMQHDMHSHKPPLHANLCLHLAIWLKRGRKQPCLTLHATALHNVNPPIGVKQSRNRKQCAIRRRMVENDKKLRMIDSMNEAGF